jgi:hypothetical protein
MKQRKCKTHKSTETASDGINGWSYIECR